LSDMQEKKVYDFKILVINPGSTSTKIAVFEGERKAFSKNILHSSEQLSSFDKLLDQKEFRKEQILQEILSAGYAIEKFSAIAARGGILPPLESGVYEVSEEMIEYLKFKSPVEHPSNLAAVIGDEIGKMYGIPVYIVDPISVDEMVPEARFSGIKDIERRSLAHALNIKRVCRKVSEEIGRSYSELNMVVVHLGGGISVTAHLKGRMIDVNNASDEGPFSPERTGGLPTGDVVRMAFSGKYTKTQLKREFMGRGGLIAYIGTNDFRTALKKASQDKEAKLVLDAMAYQVAKEIGGMCAILKGDVDAIAITGGMAHSMEFVENIKSYVYKFAPVFVVPGEFEMEGLALSTLQVLLGFEKSKKWRGGNYEQA